MLSKYIKRSILSKDKCCFCYIFVGFKLTDKDCLSFPCCGEHFDICKECLIKHPQKCPQCRKAYTLEYSKVINWYQILRYISTIGFYFCVIFTLITLKKRYEVCSEQSCHNIPMNDLNPELPYCSCENENYDIILHIVYASIFTLYLLMPSGT